MAELHENNGYSNMKKNLNKKRCTWCKNDPMYLAYHDTEWGVPIYDPEFTPSFMQQDLVISCQHGAGQ